MVDQEVLTEAEQQVGQLGLRVVESDLERPWGGFLRFDNDQADEFEREFFADSGVNPAEVLPRSPKLLFVAPDKRMSWQHHHRRSERWHVLKGPVKVMVSDSDSEAAPRELQKGEEIEIAQGQRHRLIGEDNWGVVAELWQHTNPEHPSDESDVVRIQDDFNRKTPEGS